VSNIALITAVSRNRVGRILVLLSVLLVDLVRT
jgi:hypothetical protein